MDALPVFGYTTYPNMYRNCSEYPLELRLFRVNKNFIRVSGACKYWIQIKIHTSTYTHDNFLSQPISIYAFSTIGYLRSLRHAYLDSPKKYACFVPPTEGQ